MPVVSSPPVASAVRVVLGDGRSLFRAGLAGLLGAQPGLLLVAEAADAPTLLAGVAATGPDVALLDLSLPGGAIEAAAAIRARHPRTEAFLYGLPDDAALFVRALHAGVKGFADAAVTVDSLVAAIQGVAAGEVMVSPGLVRHLAVAYSELLAGQQARRPRGGTELTQRELELLPLIAAGYSNRAAAAALGLSEHTVRAHLRSITRKLEVQNRVQVVSEAIRTGLLTGETAGLRRPASAGTGNRQDAQGSTRAATG